MQLTFKGENHNVFTEENNKIALSSNDDKRMQAIDSVEMYVYEMNKELVWKKEKLKRNSMIKQYKKWLILML